MRKLKHYLEYVGTKGLSATVSALPLFQARKLGRWLGRFTFAVLRIRRAVTLANLTQAFPEKSKQEVLALGRSVYEHFGTMMVEYLRLPAIQPPDIFDLIAVAGKEVFDAAQQAGRGAILLTGHFGNWEYLGVWISASGYPATYMFQEQRNPLVSKLIRDYRERMGMEVVPRGMGVRSYLRALRNGRFIAVVADQDAGRNGIFIDFFGRPASTALGPARFALKTGAALILGLSYRDSEGNLHAHIEPLEVDVHGLDEDAAMRQVMTAYTNKLEEWIRRYPSQWFWMHKRWKTHPQVEAVTPTPAEDDVI